MHSSVAARTVEIAPTRGFASLRLRELWDCRELLWFLVWRDVQVRYKQTAIGVGWAVIQPLVATIIFSVVFGRLAHLPSGNVPYPLFTFTALLAWNFVSTGVSRAALSLVTNASLVTKVYFPRLLIPIAAALAGTPDFLITLLLFVGMMAFYGASVTLAVVTLPLFWLLAFMTTLGLGLWLAALNARYRDVGHTIPFLIQVWLYASPIGYSAHLVPDRWRIVYALNPMAGVIEGFRWSLLGAPPQFGTIILPSTLVASALLLSGASFFKWNERTVADVI